MDEIIFQVQHDEENGRYSAFWDDPNGSGGISTQGESLHDLQRQVFDAVEVHFDEAEQPGRIRLHFVNDPILVPA